MPELKVVRRTVGKTKAVTAAASAAMVTRRRRVLVAGGLVATLTITSVLLLVLQPAPLTAEGGRTLMSLTNASDLDTLFETRIPFRSARWKYVYVHHGGPKAEIETTEAGGTPDHFVIGNGDTIDDGVIKVGQRWNTQQGAGKTAGLDRVDPDCISICLAGDLDRSPPTPRQMEQLRCLVTSLQKRLQVGREKVCVVDAPNLPAGGGKFFPRDAFQAALLP